MHLILSFKFLQIHSAAFGSSQMNLVSRQIPSAPQRLIQVKLLRFIQIGSDSLRPVGWEKGNRKMRTHPFHQWFDMNNTARTHARTGRNDLPVGVLCPCRLASPQPPTNTRISNYQASWRFDTSLLNDLSALMVLQGFWSILNCFQSWRPDSTPSNWLTYRPLVQESRTILSCVAS